MRHSARTRRRVLPLPALVAATLAVLLLTTPARAADTSCTSPILIGDGAVLYNTLDDDPEGNSTCDPLGTAKTTWWKYTASCDGDFVVDTCSSVIDTVVSAHADLCPAGIGTELGCNDNCSIPPPGSFGCTGTDSCMTLPVFQGQEVLLRVNGANNEDGSYRLSTRCVVPNDYCSDAEPVPINSTVSGSTRGADWDQAPVCNGFDNTSAGVWYTVVGNGNVLEASLCGAGTDYDTKISVYCAGCGGQQCITANDDFCGLGSQVSWCSTPGEIYHILVHGWQQNEGSFDLQITDTGTYCGPYYANCAPANDTCQAAQPFQVQILGDNTSAATDGTASCQVSTGDVWYEKSSQCYGSVTYDTCLAAGTLADTVLSVQDACGGTELACNDDASGCGLRSEVTLTTEPGRDYVLRVADYAGNGADEGTFVLSSSAIVTEPVVPMPGLHAGGTALWRLNRDTESITGLGWLSGDFRGMTWASGMGLIFAVGFGSPNIWVIPSDGGAATTLSTTAAGSYRALAWDPVELTLFSVDNTTGNLVRIDPFTGAQTPLFGLGTFGVEALAYHPDSGTLYGWDSAVEDLLIIDPDGPSVSWAGTSSTIAVRGLAWDGDTRTLWGIGHDSASGANRIARIDPATSQVVVDDRLYTVLSGDVTQALTYIEGLPPGTLDQPYAGSLAFSGGCPSYLVYNETGLPAGLSMDSSGLITGTPTQSGVFLIDFALDDTDIGTPAVGESTTLRIAPPHDSCTDPRVISDGSYAFTNIGADTDGPDEGGPCMTYGDTQVRRDVWFSYQATCTGDLTVSACNVDYDAKMAVYSGLGCPAGNLLECDDDGCNPGPIITRPVVAGDNLTIRVGGWAATQGSGFLDVSCIPTGGCCGAAGGCSVQQQSVCTGAGGAYLGDSVACSPDSDGDGWNDTCETCPADPGKHEPGVCGCGIPDSDLDGDTIPDCIDTDKDGDLVLDADDWEPLNPFSCRDDDGDSCDDCTNGFYDTADDGPDSDLDGICDLTDCADGDASVWRLPGEAENLAFAADTVTLSWNPPSSPGGQPGGLLYDLLRGDIPDDFTVAACQATDTAFDQELDTANPAPNQVFYYLVRAQNGCGNGDLGVGYPLNPRIGPGCP